MTLQQKEVLENVIFSSCMSPRKRFLRLVLCSTQHGCILNECCIKHDAVINPVDLRIHGEGTFV